MGRKLFEDQSEVGGQSRKISCSADFLLEMEVELLKVRRLESSVGHAKAMLESSSLFCRSVK